MTALRSPLSPLGKVAEDSGPGSITRFLNEYWFKQAGIPFNLNAQTNGSVYFRTGRENYDLVHDIETGVTQEIVVDNFIIADFESPSVNNSADGGPYHVLFYSPNDNLDTCYVARDNWLENPANQKIVVEFLAALYQAERIFISNPAAFVTFAEKFLPLSPASDIQYSSLFYPAHFTYWPYGVYNLQGNQSLAIKFQDTVNFFMEAGYSALPSITPRSNHTESSTSTLSWRPCSRSGPSSIPKKVWVNANFTADLQAWVPSWMESEKLIWTLLPISSRPQLSDLRF